MGATRLGQHVARHGQGIHGLPLHRRGDQGHHFPVEGTAAGPVILLEGGGAVEHDRRKTNVFPGTGGRDPDIGILVGPAPNQFRRERCAFCDQDRTGDEIRRIHRHDHDLCEVVAALAGSAPRPGDAHQVEEILVGALEPGMGAARHIAVPGKVAPTQLQAAVIVIFQDSGPFML